MGFVYPNFGYMAPMGGMLPQQPAMGQVFRPMQSDVPSLPAGQAASQGAQGISPASRIVTGREEAMGVPADFSGSLMVLPDITHNRVYVKRWNYQTGAADFCEYSPAQTSDVDRADPEYVSLNVFNATVSRLREEIDALKKPAPKGARKNDPDE